MSCPLYGKHRLRSLCRMAAHKTWHMLLRVRDGPLRDQLSSCGRERMLAAVCKSYTIVGSGRH